MDHPEVKKYMSGINIKWIFNIQRAPWWGGFFERMIQMLKRCLRKLIRQAKFSYEELLTGVAEVEAILNSRPLTYLTTDDIDEPITPSHLISGVRLLSMPDHLCGQDPEEFTPNSSRLIMNKQMKYLSTTLDHFWARWRKEYLLELRESHRKLHKSNPDTVSVGDVIIVHDDGPRGFWRLGIIEKLIKGKDSQVRGAVVRVKSGQGVSSFMKRPIQRLFPLEVHHEDQPSAETETNQELDNDNLGTESIPEQGNASSEDNPTNITSESVHVTSDSPTESHPTRPRRRAAIDARDKLIGILPDV